MGIPGLIRADRQALHDFLPVDSRLNTSSVRRDTLRIARRLEAELGPEPDFPLAAVQASLPVYYFPDSAHGILRVTGRGQHP